MPRFEDNILGLVPKDEWLDVGLGTVTRPNDPADQLFGDIRTNNLVAYWESIAAEYNVPLMAQFHGFDTEAQQTFRVPVDTHNIEKGLIKVKINQSERMRALLRSGVQNDELYDYVLNDGIRLADQVITRTKVAKNELLATGKVTIKENDLDLTVENVMKSSRQHRRCGTSFLLIVICISVIVFLLLGFAGIKSGLWRLLWRIILIPVIAGVSFEALRYAGSHEGGIIDQLVKPGLALQKLVTREPNEAECEVAIAAIEAVFDWRKWQGKE